jgi:hypothetical protein
LEQEANKKGMCSMKQIMNDGKPSQASIFHPSNPGAGTADRRKGGKTSARCDTELAAMVDKAVTLINERCWKAAMSHLNEATQLRPKEAIFRDLKQYILSLMDIGVRDSQGRIVGNDER